MLKILSIGIVVILILGGLGYFRFVASKNNLASPSSQTQTQPQDSSIPGVSPQEVPKTLPALTPDQKVEDLQNKVDALTNQLNSIKQTSQDSRISALEASVTDLRARMAVLEKGNTSSGSKYPLYIPLGSNGDVTSTDWATLDNFQVTVDPADYPGYSSVQLEVNMRLNDPKGGTVYARLINISDNSAFNEQTSTTSTSFILSSTNGFSLPTGRKTYKLQVKTASQAEILVSDAHLKVNF